MISVVIPTLNAAADLPRCFDSLIAATIRGIVKEVIVADGGSSDATLAIADGAGAHVLAAGRSRASRMIAGAKAARGEAILFLWPQTALEHGWDAEVESFFDHMRPDGMRAAAFRFAVDDFGGHARRREMRAALRSFLFGLPFGDQALLIPRRLYTQLGGMREGAHEDLELVRRIGRGRLVMLRSRAINIARAEPRPGFAMTLLHALRVPVGVMRLLA